MTLRVDWLADWQTTSECETGWLKNWFTDRLTISLTESLKDWVAHWVTDWLAERVRLTDRLTDWQASIQTLFYFSLRSFPKHRRAREKEKYRTSIFFSPTPTPLRWRSINPPRFLFFITHAQQTLKKKRGSVNGLLTDWLDDWETCRLTSRLNDYLVWFSFRRENYPVWRERSFKLKKKGPA